MIRTLRLTPVVPLFAAIVVSCSMPEHRPLAVSTEHQVERQLAAMSLEEKAGQLIMPWVLGDFAPEGSASHERVLDFIEDHKIGGIIMSVGTPFEVAAKLKQDLLAWLKHTNAAMPKPANVAGVK